MAETDTFPSGDPARITGYHAHIYYTPETRDTAARLRLAIESEFDEKIVMGRWRDFEVGPHTQMMYQVVFDTALFPEIVPYLMTRRDGLSVLIHPCSGNGYNDHVHYPIWLGPQFPINKAAFKGHSDG